MYYLTQKQAYSISQFTSVQINADLPCSHSGITSITYSIGDYSTSLTPTWITINSTTGTLSISTPGVNSDTELNFYIISSVNGLANPIQKRIVLTIKAWAVSNCLKCLRTSIYIWEQCNSGYNLEYEKCTKISQTVEALVVASKSITGASLCVSFFRVYKFFIIIYFMVNSKSATTLLFAFTISISDSKWCYWSYYWVKSSIKSSKYF